MSSSQPTKLFLFFLATLFTAITLLAYPQITQAEEKNTYQTIRVSPIILRIDLSPGKVLHKTITVDNLLDIPMPLKASVEGFDASDEENGIKVSDTGVTSPLTDWISISDTDTILAPKSSKDFSVSINIPEKVELGGYYAVIFFTPLLPNFDPSIPTQVSARIGVLALASIGVQDTKNLGSVLNFDFDKRFFQQNPLKTTIRVKNTGLNFFTASPTLSIKPLFGIAESFLLEEKTILPGKVRRWEKNLELKNISGGIYTAKLSVSTEKGDFVFSKTYLYGFPLKKSLIFISLAIALVYSLIFRHRVIRAVKLLFKGN